MLPREFSKRFWISSFYLIVANSFVIALITSSRPPLSWLWYILGFIVIGVPYAYYLRFSSRVLGFEELKRRDHKRYVRVVAAYSVIFVAIALVLTLLFLSFSYSWVKLSVLEALESFI